VCYKYDALRLPKIEIPKIPPEEKSPVVSQLLEIITQAKACGYRIGLLQEPHVYHSMIKFFKLEIYFMKR
jgi:hypothetical protein